ncbi:MAG: hypothetical protein COV08_00645 [Candidatus Vogelbacteria bacterium CG10_big_fil_rev_8_21_14_0_10_49_38]|uniref:Uncharacterized protein n=1 Tax=Candidatus Vogelbacteria bacterium CG10_big_fil_rev_8_21_14_0_10_49_38 TaxID=1975043 RepID=A0A2H0RI73_9BACT|nr:MAG: hypothetical protein BK006_00655 [bacterium CG10_49_38]PIR46262.1 MAG: hypothetical protein COV08_00645 [Candidatus Vogelbacteria bacterium CG10_big_fil_rev_8_21_14_0_10_49_38]
MIDPRCHDHKSLIKPLVIAVAIFLTLTYSALKVKDFVAGPDITLYSPADGDSPQSDLVVIKGKAERISEIFINGRKIFTDEAGNFKESYLLANGYNLLEIYALDQFGRQVVKKLQLVFNEKS